MTIELNRIKDKDNSIVGICRGIPIDGFDLDQEIIDLSSCSWLQIGEIVSLAAIIKNARHRGIRVQGTCSSGTDLFRYLQRVNFFQELGITQEESFYRHEQQLALLEISEIDRESRADEIPSRLRAIVSAQTNVEPSLVSALGYAFGEIIDNVNTHSHTEIKGLVAAQHYPGKSYVEFCVADCGIGVAESLRRNPDYSEMTDAQLLQMAFDNGVGENTTSFNTIAENYGNGFGLTFAERLVSAAKGDLWMISNSAGVHISGNSREQIHDISYPGTILCARIPANVLVTEDDVLRNGSAKPYFSTESELFDIGDILW